ncbi:Kinetochore protein spc24-like protein [Thalictrum thalictroides]|uniref:Kinetochore protein spc24-like protein n=1 Tax=Thalictrum thalictroides TaxID=46969 RepID=A0A7J6W1S7_THATH|nr:Kinetochore protein spc24-like protein [Thalictrum thalictroides]
MNTIVSNQISDLERQSSTVEDQRQILNKCDKDVLKAQRNLKMYVLVSKILPTMDEPTKISGSIVDKVKESVEKFEFDPANASSFNICNSLWKMSE